MKKFFIYNVCINYQELIFRRYLNIYNVVREKEDCYEVVNIHNPNDVHVIFKNSPYVNGEVSEKSDADIDDEWYTGGFLFEDGDNNLIEKEYNMMKKVDALYKSKLDKFFRSVDNMKKSFEKVLKQYLQYLND